MRKLFCVSTRAAACKVISSCYLQPSLLQCTSPFFAASFFCFLFSVSVFSFLHPTPTSLRAVISNHLYCNAPPRLQNPRFRGKKSNCNAVNKLGADLKPTLPREQARPSPGADPISYLDRRPPHSSKLKTLRKNYFTTHYRYLDKRWTICKSNLI